VAEAEEAATEFDRVFGQRERPTAVEEFRLPDEDPVNLPTLLRAAGVVASAGEARRLIAQGAISTESERLVEEWISRRELAGQVVKVGKRRYIRLIAD
jgi:tyrosyl-tRNA synthetase